MLQNTKLCFYFVILSFPYHLEAAPDCEQWIAKLVSEQGRVEKQRSNQSDWQQVKKNETFCQGDKIRTRKRSRVTLEFGNEALVTLEQRSTLIFPIVDKGAFSWILELFQGAAFFRSRSPHQLKINTPFINAVHEGTEFMVAVNEQQTEISVFDGRVAAENQTGRVQINKGQVGITTKDQITQVQALTIHPKDAVQWALYYPPIVDYQKPASILTVPGIKKTITHYQQGDVFQALQALDQIPKPQQDEHYIALKASLLLTVGNVEEALLEINQAEQHLETALSTGLAIKAVIAVSKNKTERASELALKATEINPESAVAKIALSYVYQAQFKIDNALATTEQATQLTPKNALAWARLAELQLSTGDRSGALESAQKAQSLNPQLGRTQTILGFANLAQIDIEEAKTAFTTAIDLNSADPLARLGLGLAKIRKGAIKEGTRDLETAVSLDPDNAIMRSYLGKAYYELKNEGYAATEFAIAKDMDPNDPTPWFYDAILKQTTNRPIEALHDMQKAIELNDNRGVYRSTLLLDEDAAAKSANMARIYQDLGFDRVALKQAWTSLGHDFTNPSAHRFLSDTLQGRPRQRVARASELLQAQLFQPINTVPVQPQLTSENIGILNSTGPGSISSTEYDPLFTSNGAHIFLNGAIGSNDTRTDNAIITGVYDQFSMSLGQFQFQTDGFRKNDDYTQNIYNAFAQVAITPDLNIQVEFKREDVTAGDVALRFNGFHRDNVFRKVGINNNVVKNFEKSDFKESSDQDTARFGLRYKIDPQQDFIFSAFLTRFEEVDSVTTKKLNIFRSSFDPGGDHTTTTTKNIIRNKESGYQLEGQYLFHPETFDIIAGFGFINLDTEIATTEQTKKLIQFIDDDPLIPPDPITVLSDNSNNKISTLETNIYSGYIYSQFEITKQLTSVLGLSYDNYSDSLTRKNQLNPKVGLTWNPTNWLTLRGAAFRTLKKPLAAKQTIEPTQVAGFNQFFDGNNGTTAWNYGFGLDLQLSKKLFIGGELLWRDTTQPVIAGNIAKPQDRDESAHLAYLYWAPLSWAAFSSEYRFTKFRRDYTANSTDSSDPRSVTTHQVPLSLNFYHSSGLFSKLSTTFVDQSIEFVNSRNGLDKDNGNFWIFDAAIGYRLPKRIGSLSLEVRNLFDNNNFKYHSIFDASGPQLTDFIPEREVFFKLNIAY